MIAYSCITGRYGKIKKNLYEKYMPCSILSVYFFRNVAIWKFSVSSIANKNDILLRSHRIIYFVIVIAVTQTHDWSDVYSIQRSERKASTQRDSESYPWDLRIQDTSVSAWKDEITKRRETFLDVCHTKCREWSSPRINVPFYRGRDVTLLQPTTEWNYWSRQNVFLFQERDFDKHVAYCRDEPAAQEFLQTNNEVREYFEVRVEFRLINEILKYSRGRGQTFVLNQIRLARIASWM